MSILSTPNEEEVYFNFINSLKSDVTKKTYEREIRKYYKQIIQDYVYIIRSIIPEEVIDEHFEVYCERLKQL